MPNGIWPRCLAAGAFCVPGFLLPNDTGTDLLLRSPLDNLPSRPRASLTQSP